MRSLNTGGKFSGGGVCLNCRDKTTGVNCERCLDGYYRPQGVSRFDPNPCVPCDCRSNGAEAVDRCYQVAILKLTTINYIKMHVLIFPRMTNWLTEALELDTVFVGLASPDPSATNAPLASWTSPPAGPAPAPWPAPGAASATGTVCARGTPRVLAVTDVGPDTLLSSLQTLRDALSASATESPAPATLQVLAWRYLTMSQDGTSLTSVAE